MTRWEGRLSPKQVQAGSNPVTPASLCQEDGRSWQRFMGDEELWGEIRPLRPVNPTDAVCARCGEGYGAPCHNPMNYMSHGFVFAFTDTGAR